MEQQSLRPSAGSSPQAGAGPLPYARGREAADALRILYQFLGMRDMQVALGFKPPSAATKMYAKKVAEVAETLGRVRASMDDPRLSVRFGSESITFKRVVAMILGWEAEKARIEEAHKELLRTVLGE